MKHLVLLIGYATAGLLAALFLMGFERVVPVHCGPNDLPLDDVVNADDPSKGTRFQLDGGCTYTVDSVLALKNGDEIAGPEGSFIPRAPAFDPEPTATIVGSEGLSNVIRPEGTVPSGVGQDRWWYGSIFGWHTGSRHGLRARHGHGVKRL